MRVHHWECQLEDVTSLHPVHGCQCNAALEQHSEFLSSPRSDCFTGKHWQLCLLVALGRRQARDAMNGEAPYSERGLSLRTVVDVFTRETLSAHSSYLSYLPGSAVGSKGVRHTVWWQAAYAVATPLQNLATLLSSLA